MSEPRTKRYERVTFTAITNKYWHFCARGRRMFTFGCDVLLVIYWLGSSCVRGFTTRRHKLPALDYPRDRLPLRVIGAWTVGLVTPRCA